MRDLEINKNIIDIYKKLLWSKLDDYKKWTKISQYSSSLVIHSEFLDDKNDLYFQISYKENFFTYTQVSVKSVNKPYNFLCNFEIHIFNKMYNRVIDIKKYFDNKSKIDELEEKEKILINGVPNDFKRSIKLSKIISKITKQ